jgi:hypothetical protein
MPKGQDWEPITKLRKKIITNNALMAIGIVAISSGAFDSLLGETQIDNEFKRRYPAPITAAQGESNEQTLNSLYRMVAKDAFREVRLSEQIKKEIDKKEALKTKFDEQTSYKKGLRTFFNPDLSQPKNRFIVDLLAMVGGTCTAIYGAWSKRKSLTELYDIKRN